MPFFPCLLISENYERDNSSYGKRIYKKLIEKSEAWSSLEIIIEKLEADGLDATGEKNWLEYAAHIFRLPGIYGPGRSSLDRLRNGLSKRIDYPNHLFSRIHVDDIAQSIVASINKPNPNSIYNICDDEAAEQQLVEAYASKLLGIEAPPLVPFKQAIKEMSPMAQTFWQDNRQVSNVKIKNELGINLLYPTFREGLKAIYQISECINKTV